MAEESKGPGGAGEGAAAGNYAVNFNLDLNSGHIVGTQEALNALAPPGEALGQNILKAIGQALRPRFPSTSPVGRWSAERLIAQNVGPY